VKELSLMERFADPELILGLSGAEMAQGALTTTLMGMCITFVVLALLLGLIALLTKIMAGAGVKPEPAAAGDENAVDDSVLIAVITAAIAEYEGENAVRSELFIRRIDRTAGIVPAWGTAGNREAIASRKM
jgi:sodium pump decarboxylase gamma subunit